ncbi:MAG: MFS transporter [Deltaproteobacteria bacterium]|nr:MFS transporter [Deltaproteobacteria bacterium]
MNSRERYILYQTCYAHFMAHFNMQVFPALVLPLATLYRMDMAQVVGMSFGMYLLFGLSALVWGPLADRLGPRPLMLLFYSGAAVAAGLCALQYRDPAVLPVCLAALGFFSGIYHPVGLGWLSKEMRRISRALALNGIFGSLGIALAPLTAGLAIRLWGISGAFMLVAIVNGLGVLLMLVFAERPRELREDVTPAATGHSRPVPFAVLLVIMMLAGLVYRGSTVILPACLELRNAGLLELARSFAGEWLTANLAATMTAGLILLPTIFGQYAGGFLAERFDLRLTYLLFHAITIPAILVMAHAFDLPLVFMGIAYFFFLLGTQPIENTLVARYTPDRFRHSAFGLKFALTFGAGALAVKMIAVVKKTGSLEDVYQLLAGVSLLLVCCIVILILVTRPQRKPQS